MAAKKKGKDAAPEEGADKKSKKKIVIIIIVLLFLGAVGAGISFWFFKLRDPGASPTTPPATPVALAETGPVTVTSPATMIPADSPRQPVSMLSLPSVMVNLSDAAGDRYLKLSMDVEVSTPDAATELMQQQARVRDAMIMLLSSKTYTELAVPEGKMQLKNDIAARLNQILGTPRVVRIYFTEFVVT